MKIVIPTCDKYAHTIPAHIHFLRKLWPQCPYDVIVITNEENIDVDATVIKLGKDLGFADNLHLFLRHHMHDELMMLCLDDLIPVEIYPRRIARALAALTEDSSVCMVRLSKRFTTKGTPYKRDALFVRMAKDNPFLFSQKGTIWQTGVFRRLLRRHATPWTAERIGAERAKSVKGKFLGATKPILVQRNWFTHGKRDKKTTIWIRENW
ncbi:hypothetical protein LCGC14_0275340 [marine sediment metagenome]|uniref:Glycosyltransferase 2-like domain-containing protein n=1 Tax=marine sediment metagenome TaxID=412755 RepID=A0A0F9U2C3_9ZZZZ